MSISKNIIKFIFEKLILLSNYGTLYKTIKYMIHICKIEKYFIKENFLVLYFHNDIIISFNTFTMLLYDTEISVGLPVILQLLYKNNRSTHFQSCCFKNCCMKYDPLPQQICTKTQQGISLYP